MASGIKNGMYKHGMSYGSKFYKCWINMKTRCTNISVPDFFRYGGRGIRISSDWANDFESFYKDMFESYKEGLSLDRIDNNKGYNNENCRWVDMQSQSNNRRSNFRIEINGVTKNLEQWVRHFEQKSSTVRQRIYVYGWDVVSALTYKRGANWPTVNLQN